MCINCCYSRFSLVCQNESEDSLIRSFVGRIGVSLMLRYHKTHQWAKVTRLYASFSESQQKIKHVLLTFVMFTNVGAQGGRDAVRFKSQLLNSERSVWE